MKIYGTTTSPFVRRVCVVAAEVGEQVELIDTATEDGQARLRGVSPIWKVPVAEVDGRTLYDSRVIIEWLVTTRGWGTLAPSHDRWHDDNLINAINGAVDSLIQLMYLTRDGVALEGVPYRQRQHDRTAAILDWVGSELTGNRHGNGFGLVELALITSLDWIDFRKVYDTSRHPAVAAIRAGWADRPSLVATRPRT